MLWLVNEKHWIWLAHSTLTLTFLIYQIFLRAFGENVKISFIGDIINIKIYTLLYSVIELCSQLVHVLIMPMSSIMKDMLKKPKANSFNIKLLFARSVVWYSEHSVFQIVKQIGWKNVLTHMWDKPSDCLENFKNVATICAKSQNFFYPI